VELKK
jgi:hypothetical protein